LFLCFEGAGTRQDLLRRSFVRRHTHLALRPSWN
jgi:hypothetical protein